MSVLTDESIHNIQKYLNLSKHFLVEFEACRPLSLGNGQCDAINNNNECEFDGGDCCTFDDEDCLKCYGDYCTCHATGKRMCGGMPM